MYSYRSRRDHHYERQMTHREDTCKWILLLHKTWFLLSPGGSEYSLLIRKVDRRQVIIGIACGKKQYLYSSSVRYIYIYNYDECNNDNKNDGGNNDNDDVDIYIYIHYRQKIWNIFYFIDDFLQFCGMCMVFQNFKYIPTSRYYFGGNLLALNSKINRKGSKTIISVFFSIRLWLEFLLSLYQIAAISVRVLYRDIVHNAMV